MLNDLTTREVRNAIIKKGISIIDHHPCSLCGYMTAFVIEGDVVRFDAGCLCADYSEFRPSSFQAIADWHNIQENDEHRKNIRNAIGIGVDYDRQNHENSTT